MGYVLQSIDPKVDAAGVARAMISAMYEDTHWRLSFPGMPIEDIITGCAKRLPRNLITERDIKRYQKAVDVDTGEIVGYARWIMPQNHLDEWQEAQIPAPSDDDVAAFEALWSSDQVNGQAKGQNVAYARAMSGALGAVNDEIQAQGPVMELEYLTVMPSHQRRGVGALLVASGLDQADKMGVRAYVMSKPAGLRLYKQHGFEEYRVVVQDSTKFGGSPGHTNVFMLRSSPRQ